MYQTKSMVVSRLLFSPLGHIQGCSLVLLTIVILCCVALFSAAVAEDDVKCLRGVKESLSDPQGKLSSWSFSNISVGSLCKFVGVACWNDRENRIFGLELPDMKLSGEIPKPLEYCQSMQTLDLSGNRLYGNIPSQICTWLPYLVTLDLSNNDLSGTIPPDLANCSFLNSLLLADNQLSGIIPSQLSSLGRLKKFSVANNRLTGTIPSAFGKFDKAGFDGNSGLWGRERGDMELEEMIIAAGLRATNNFHPENIINSTRTGTSYKAILPDGSALAIKRLNTCNLGEKQFRSEMNRLGQFRHPNLAPLLGFCAVEEEKLLVYKYMSNGTLYSLLHGNGTPMDWATRFRIGLGAARGLAWLHHGCQPPLLHENISSNVILIDDDFDARIVDFGLARLMATSDSNGSSFVNGGLGEFVTNAEEGFKGNLVEWVNQLCGSGRNKDVIDEALCGKGHDEEILQFLKIACNCLGPRPKDRLSMYQAFESLKSMGDHHGFSEHYDEFPLIFGKQDHDNQANFAFKHYHRSSGCCVIIFCFCSAKCGDLPLWAHWLPCFSTLTILNAATAAVDGATIDCNPFVMMSI
ncbi:unnamed protein product, partial [Vitis vinifera]